MSNDDINEIFGIAEEEQHQTKVCHAGNSATSTMNEPQKSEEEQRRKKRIAISVIISALGLLIFAIECGNDIIGISDGWSAATISFAIAAMTVLGILLVRQVFRLIVWAWNKTDAFEFSGRARRSTYWTMVVFSSMLIGILCAIVAGVAGNAFEYGVEEGFKELGGVAVLLILLVFPFLVWTWAVQVRRCHDLGWSGWAVIAVWLVGFIPLVGWIACLIFTIFLGFVDSQPFTNQYGPDPKGRNFSPAVNNPHPLPSTAAPAIPTITQYSLADQLRELKQLFDEGILTQEEFAAQKAKVLDGKSVVADATRTEVVDKSQADVTEDAQDEIANEVQNEVADEAQTEVAKEMQTNVADEAQTRDADEAQYSTRKDSSIIFGDSAPQMVAIPGKGFSISKYPVTQDIWEKVMGANPSAFMGANRPVENVSWDDCQKFIGELNACPDVVASGLPYRLPSVEEWIFACLADSSKGFCRLADGTEITRDTAPEVAWYCENSGDETHPVGQKKPNAFGLYDMLGNVWEWTSTKGGFGYVNCGGSFGSAICRADTKYSNTPDNISGSLGFRLARGI